MKIHIYTIHKNETLTEMVSYYAKACKGFGVELAIQNLFNKHIQYAHKQDSNMAKKSYTIAFEKYLDKNSILLDCNGKSYDSIGFSGMIDKYLCGGVLKFFIAGAYGFEDGILDKYPKISLSTLTFSHEIAKIVLLEQIYRSLSIIKKHPYHKI